MQPQRWIALYCLLMILCGAVATGKETAEQSRRITPATGGEKPLARVDGEVITEAQVLRRLRAFHGDIEPYRQDTNRWQRMLEAGIDAEIRDRLLLQAAISAKLEVTPEEISSARRRSAEILGEARYKEMFSARGVQENDYDAFLRKRLLIDKYKAGLFSEIQVDETTLRSYYEGHKEFLRQPARVQLEVVTAKDPKTAREIYQGFKDKQDVERLLRKHSPSSGQDENRTLRWLSYDDLPTSVRERIEAAKPGDVLEPMEDSGSFRVVRIRATMPARTPSFEEVKEKLNASLSRKKQQAVLDNWYENARRTAKIEYLP